MEAQLSSEDCGRDLAAVQNLLKKHQLLEADITAHEVHTHLSPVVISSSPLSSSLPSSRTSHLSPPPPCPLLTSLQAFYSSLGIRLLLRHSNILQYLLTPLFSLSFLSSPSPPSPPPPSSSSSLSSSSLLLLLLPLPPPLFLTQDRLGDLNAQARRFVKEQHFDAGNIQEKQRNINDRYTRFERVTESE